jgi:hypothetical protein
VHVRQGESFTVRSEEPEGVMEGEFRISDAGNGRVFIRMKLKKNNETVGEPSLLAELGATSDVAISGKDGKQTYKLKMTVNLAAKPATGA